MENCTWTIFQTQMSVQLVTLLSGILLSSLLTSWASFFYDNSHSHTRVRWASYLGLCTLQLQQCHIHCNAKMLRAISAMLTPGEDNDNEDVAIQKPMKTVARMQGQTAVAQRGKTKTETKTETHWNRCVCLCVCVLTMGNRTTTGKQQKKQQKLNEIRNCINMLARRQ